MKVGYVVKRYPRYSETFIVNEILAHERAGLELEIFALRSTTDTHFQDAISRVRAPVTHLRAAGIKPLDFWLALQEAAGVLPGFWERLEVARGEDSRDVYQAAMLAREVRLRGIEHLHAHFGTAAATVTRLAARFAGVPYTFTAHAKDIFHEYVIPEGLGRKLADAASVVTVSDYNLGFLRRNYGSAASGVRRIYNGLDLEQFTYEFPRERPPRIVAVGRLVEKKGFSDLIESCAILRDRDIRFGCRIIGMGPLETELREKIRGLDLQPEVELAGPRPQRELLAHIQNAAVFAAPCVIGPDGNRDGLPTVLLEAMALGTPCVSTDVTGIPEVLRDGQTGLMADQRDPASLANALERLLADSGLRIRLASEARALIEAEFDVDCNAARLREVFETAGRVERPANLGTVPTIGEVG